ncbi:MAG: transposase [Alphaproteobacteria bacterium]
MLTRKQHRLKYYDYSSNGAYFITICTKDKKCVLGNVINEKMILNELGIIAQAEIEKTKKFRDNVFINHYVIMPNHVHLMIKLRRDTACCVRNNEARNFGKTQSQSISAIIRAYKSAVTRAVRISGHSTLCPYSFEEKRFWQNGYHDHVVRCQKTYHELLKYIDENPIKWHLDRYHVHNN